MAQTTLIFGCGILVLASSTFVPTANFACLMFVMLLAALAGDLILLPALLLGPLGDALELKPGRQLAMKMSRLATSLSVWTARRASSTAIRCYSSSCASSSSCVPCWTI